MYYPEFETFKKLTNERNLIPIYRDILADMETPVSALLKLSSTRSYAFLLESVEGGEKWGRYTFLGSDPAVIFRVRAEDVVIREDGEIRNFKHNGDPLKFLKDLMGRYRPAYVDGLPRFYGGAVGFFGYDIVRYFERLPATAKDDLKADEAVFLITDTLIVFDNVRHTIKVVACAFTEGRNDLKEVYEESVAKIDAMVEMLSAPVEKREGPLGQVKNFHLQSNMTPEDYKAIVMRAKEYIVSGDVIQVVLSQRFQMENNCDPIDLYRTLRFVNPSPYLFFLKLEDIILIGSSPEVMSRLEETTVELRPIAGTRRRGRNEQEDRKLLDELLNDPKERAEHVMLVDLGRNDVGRIAKIGSVQVNQLMVVERYSHVMHLVSNIRAQLSRGKDCFDVLKATFPAGTLTGAPKIRAMEIIDELEPCRRGPYGGAVGYFSFTGNMDFCITIRTIMVKDGKVFIQAGAGIVADSDPEAEYQETMKKAEGMIKAIEIVASGFEIMG